MNATDLLPIRKPYAHLSVILGLVSVAAFAESLALGSHLLAVGAGVGLVFAAVSGVRRSRSGLAVGIVGSVTVLVVLLGSRLWFEAVQARSRDNLKNIGLAIQNYHDTYGHLPPAAIRGKDGTPLLSWRVAILPFLGYEGFYEQFHLDEPWDSPHNLELMRTIPALYRAPGPNRGQEWETFYQVFVGPGSVFERDGLSSPRDIPDGRSFTILVVEAARPVPWTKPEDLIFDDGSLRDRVGGVFQGGFIFSGSLLQPHGFTVVMADASTHFVRLGPDGIDERTLRRAIKRDDGEQLDSEW